MNKHRRSVLITDLDDTIWDWLKIWHTSFSSVLSALEKNSGLKRKTLIDKIREIHQSVGTSEYYFLPYHLEKNLGRPWSNEDIFNRYGDIKSILADGQRKGTFLLPGVKKTFKEAKSKGSKIVAYTESMSFGAVQRLKATNLDGVIDTLYSREDHTILEGIDLQSIRSHPSEQYLLAETEHFTVKRSEMKPNPMVLLDIVKRVNATTDQCIYVGDKLIKDIKMAQDANVLDAHAKYGDQRENFMYDLLKEVTHWSENDVINEAQTNSAVISPSIVLEGYYSDLLKEIDFVKFE